MFICDLVTEFQLPQLAQFLDPHLLLPLFDFAEHNRVCESIKHQFSIQFISIALSNRSSLFFV
jgi:hypothetical protein